jgi:phosphoserine aminotransferase
MGLNLAHMLAEGGLAHYVNLAEIRSNLIYSAIDNSGGFYLNTTDKKYRSKMNVPFRIKPASHESSKTYFRLEEKFLVDAAKEGLL